MTVTAIIAAIAEIDRKHLPALLVAISARMATEEIPQDDDLLDVDAAADMLGVSPSFLYQKKLPFTVKLGGHRMFSRAGIQRYIRNKQGNA